MLIVGRRVALGDACHQPELVRDMTQALIAAAAAAESYAFTEVDRLHYGYAVIHEHRYR